MTQGPVPLLDVRGLETVFDTDDGTVRAVDGVDLSLARGETLGLVGESGCGKSVLSLSLLRLVPPPGRIVAGEVLFDGHDVLRLPENEMRQLRGRRVAMVFQEPMTSLNPVHTIGEQIVEALRAHESLSRDDAAQRALSMLRKVKIPAPEKRFHEYPHRLSGGMRQRVMIAMALVCRPDLLIADEPTTALDVTIQAQVLELLRELREELGMAVLLITHNFGLVAELADRVAVMYAGRIIETARVEELFEAPLHPYTIGLLKSVPRLGMASGTRLRAIPGSVPNPLALPPGCRFHPRCSAAVEECRRQEPALTEESPGHRVACARVEDGRPPLEVP